MRLRMKLASARRREMKKVAFRTLSDVVKAFNDAASDYKKILDSENNPVDHEDVKMLETELKNYANIMQREFHIKDISEVVKIDDLKAINFSEDFI
jgi:hypothetical protein